MNNKIISIDQGTSSTRSVLYDNNGQFIDAVQEEFEQIFPDDGWVEHNPEKIWNSVLNTLSALVKNNNVDFALRKFKKMVNVLSWGKSLFLNMELTLQKALSCVY